jgi:hypothetical protein
MDKKHINQVTLMERFPATATYLICYELPSNSKIMGRCRRGSRTGLSGDASAQQTPFTPFRSGVFREHDITLLSSIHVMQSQFQRLDGKRLKTILTMKRLLSTPIVWMSIFATKSLVNLIKLSSRYRPLDLKLAEKYCMIKKPSARKSQCRSSQGVLRLRSTTIWGSHHIIVEKPKNRSLSSALSFI